MATGGYPAPCRPRYADAAVDFASPEDIGRFVDVAARAGVDSFSSAGGVIVDDFDNDGQLEILTSNFDSCGPMQLFRRGADGTLRRSGRARRAVASSSAASTCCRPTTTTTAARTCSSCAAGGSCRSGKSLLRNNCDGTFTDVTVASGLAKPATSTQTAAWADIDNDGFVDLFVGNEDPPSQLFRNRGDGTFEDIAAPAGVARTAFTKGVAAADYRQRRLTRTSTSRTCGGGNFLYRNNGNRTFTEVAAAAGVPGADRGFPTWFFDYDNDGWDDLFVTSYFLSVDENARDATCACRPTPTRMKLYRNLGNGTLRRRDRAGRTSIEGFMPMGSNFGDIDNDGFLDIYLGTGSPSYAALVPQRAAAQQGRASRSWTSPPRRARANCTRATASRSPTSTTTATRRSSFKVGGATPGDAHAFRLFENPGHGRDWLGAGSRRRQDATARPSARASP